MAFEEVDYNPFEKQEMSWGEVGAESLKNIPSSAVSMAKDIYQAAIHPIETGKALGGLAAGVVEKAIPGEQPQEKYADSVGQFIKERYGSEEGLKETIANDPVGALADLATIFTGVGGALKVGAKVPGMAKMATAGKIAGEIGTAIEPLNIVAKGGVGALKAIPGSIPESIYERAAKIPPSMPAKKRIAAVKTALDEAIPPTPEGIDIIRGKVSELNSKIDSVIDSAEGRTIMTSDIAKALDEVEDFYSKSAASDIEVNAIQRVREKFLTERKQVMSVREAQEMKKATYKILKNAYKEKISSTLGSAKIEAKKSLARGAKEQIAKMFPEIDDINKKESAFLNLEEAIEQRANTIMNNNKLNLTSLILGGSVGGATGNVISGFGTVVLASIMSDAKVQSNLAILLRKAKRAKMGQVKVPYKEARLAATQAGRLTQED